MTTTTSSQIVQTMSIGKDELTDLLTGALVSADKIKVPHDTIEWECALMPMRDRRN